MGNVLETGALFTAVLSSRVSKVSPVSVTANVPNRYSVLC